MEYQKNQSSALRDKSMQVTLKPFKVAFISVRWYSYLRMYKNRHSFNPHKNKNIDEKIYTIISKRKPRYILNLN